MKRMAICCKRFYHLFCNSNVMWKEIVLKRYSAFLVNFTPVRHRDNPNIIRWGLGNEESLVDDGKATFYSMSNRTFGDEKVHRYYIELAKMIITPIPLQVCKANSELSLNETKRAISEKSGQFVKLDESGKVVDLISKNGRIVDLISVFSTGTNQYDWIIDELITPSSFDWKTSMNISDEPYLYVDVEQLPEFLTKIHQHGVYHMMFEIPDPVNPAVPIRQAHAIIYSYYNWSSSLWGELDRKIMLNTLRFKFVELDPVISSWSE